VHILSYESPVTREEDMSIETLTTTLTRVRHLWRNSHPDTIEILTGFISLWYAFVLTLPTTRSGPSWRYLFALWALSAALCKLIGVVYELRAVRLLGLALGAGFWLVLASVFALAVKGGITWGGFLLLSLAQGWAYWRVYRP
jgi:hypothetical protein